MCQRFDAVVRVVCSTDYKQISNVIDLKKISTIATQ